MQSDSTGQAGSLPPFSGHHPRAASLLTPQLPRPEAGPEGGLELGPATPRDPVSQKLC